MRGCLSAPLGGVGLPALGHSSILPNICSCHQLVAPPLKPAPCFAANNNAEALHGPNLLPHPCVLRASWLLTLQQSAWICMMLRISGRWIDPSFRKAGPAHSTSALG